MQVQKIPEDNLDESQFLPRDEPKINPFRMAKGDLLFAGSSIKVVSHLDRLRINGTFDENQHWAAVTITNIREIAFRSLGYRLMNHTLLDIKGRTVKLDTAPMDIYMEVMKPLLPWQANLVERICFQEVRENDFAWIFHHRGRVQESFDRIYKPLDAILKPSNNDLATKP